MKLKVKFIKSNNLKKMLQNMHSKLQKNIIMYFLPNSNVAVKVEI